MNQRSLSYYEGELELFENALEGCRDENRYIREFVTPRRRAALSSVPEPTELLTPGTSEPEPSQSDDEERVNITDEQIETLRETCQNYIEELLENDEISEEDYEES